MLAMNRPYKILLSIVSIIGFLALVIGIVNEIKRRNLIDYNNAIIENLSTEIDVYKNLGFHDHDKLIEITKHRLAHAQDNLDTIKKRRQVLLSENSMSVVQKETLESLLSINKEMAQHYRQEIQEYINLGVSDRDRKVKKAKDNLLLLVMEIADLERKLASSNSARTRADEVTKKIHTLIALNKESLNLYKTELTEYTQLGLPENDSKLKFVRNKITIKVGEIEALEQHLI